jgi:hypothetical protein
MNRPRGMVAIAAAAAIGLFVRSATAIDIEPTSATLTPEVLKQIAEVESEIDRIEAQTINRLATSPRRYFAKMYRLARSTSRTGSTTMFSRRDLLAASTMGAAMTVVRGERWLLWQSG